MIASFIVYLAGWQAQAQQLGAFVPLVVLGALALAAALAGYWRIFQKMGLAGWKALIPFYNNYLIASKCAEYPQFFWVYAVASVVQVLAALGLGGAFSVGLEHWARVIAIGAELYLLVELAYCFGKRWGTGLGLWLAEFVFAPLLGFGEARYLGRHVTVAHRFINDESATPNRK